MEFRTRNSILVKMKWSILIICLLAQTAIGQHFLKHRHGLPPAGAPKAIARAPELGWITQRIDHFNSTDLRTWQMRYMNNSQFYQPGGPIFIFLGGEWELLPDYLMTGQMFDMAAEHSGYMFSTEHRYYGTSFPTPDVSVKNLQYLSVDQALADLAYFIQHQREVIPSLQNSKVVVVGGSYSATMATWARIKYPHLIDAGLSSSAPLRAVADFFEYFEVVGDNLQLASQECVNTISEAVAATEQLILTEGGITLISQVFNTCERLNTSEPQRAYFFNLLATPFASIVQYAATGEIAYECNRLLSFPGSSLLKLAGYVNDFYGGSCLSDYDLYIQYFNNTALPEDFYRQWVYQTCTEYGFFRTSNSPNQPFGQTIGIDFFTIVCRDLFGFGEDILDTGIARTNLFYGSVFPEVTHLVSVHGTVDPWHTLGVLEDINPLAPVIVINGTSHGADLASESDYDIPELRAAKRRVRELIAEWIQ